MKPQEAWSRTYNHLWHGSNTMLATTPTISRHLARTLVSSIPEHGMSLLATKLHCQKCSALMTDGKVRLRKPKKRPRRAKPVVNVVMRTCAMCGHTNVDRGAESVAPPRECLEEIQQLRERNQRQRRRARETATEDGGRKKKRKGKASTQMANDGRLKKKRKRGSGSLKADGAQSAPQKSGLAASFLFDPIP